MCEDRTQDNALCDSSRRLPADGQPLLDATPSDSRDCARGAPFKAGRHLTTNRFDGAASAANESATRPAVLGASEPINLALRDHQTHLQDWSFAATVADLQSWAERFVLEFKLQVGTPCFYIAHLPRECGHYRHGRNGFGLTEEVGRNQYHVAHDPYWEVLGTVLQELLHAWQAHHGTPGRRNYHNREYREKAAVLGLLVEQDGTTTYAAGDTSFLRLLARFNIRPSCLTEWRGDQLTLKADDQRPERVGSKLKLFECSCGVKVRVGRSRFNARCLDCGTVFQRVD